MSNRAHVKTKPTPAPEPVFLPSRPGLLDRQSAATRLPGARLATAPGLTPAERTSACPASPRTCPFGGACHTCPTGLQAKLTINQPDDEYEREADRVAAAVTGPILDPTPFPLRPFGGAPRIQRNGAAYAYIRQLQARQMYDDFVRNAESYGLPVRFLRRVGRDYSISFGGSDAVNTWLNEMTLEEETLRGASQMAPSLPIGEGSAIRTIYEEATHAYLDLASNQPGFSRFIAAGERHYQGAPTTRGAATTDPGRVFQEAAANYVAHRASTWWSAFEMLSIYASMSASDAAAAARLRQMNTFGRLRDDYNRGMAERVFGYSEEGGFLGIGAKQAETTRPMIGGMKTFLDHELLEDKIPDSFDAVAGFRQLLNRAGVTLGSPAIAPAPPVQRQLAEKGVPGPAPEALKGVENQVAAPGQSLDAATRAFFEPRFGYDFSAVRIHSGPQAAESAAGVNARAYTLGHDIVFAAGEYAPQTETGQRLLAHELAHVVQQRPGILYRDGPSSTGPSVSMPSVTSLLFRYGDLSLRANLPTEVVASLPVQLRNVGVMTFSLSADIPNNFTFAVTLDTRPHLRIETRLSYNRETGQMSMGLTFTSTTMTCTIPDASAVQADLQAAGERLTAAIQNFVNPPEAAPQTETGGGPSLPPEIDRAIELGSAIGALYSRAQSAGAGQRCISRPVWSLGFGAQIPVNPPQSPDLFGPGDRARAPSPYFGGTFTWHF